MNVESRNGGDNGFVIARDRLHFGLGRYAALR
jgi:hypothetical protein